MGVALLTLAPLSAGCSSADAPSPGVVPTEASVATPTGPTVVPGPSSSESASPSAPATTPTPGNVDQTVPARVQKSERPVKLDEESKFGGGLDVVLSTFGTQRVKVKIPGQVAGDALVFDLTVKNSSAETVDLNALVVNVFGSDGVAGSRVTTKPASAPPQVVGPGGTARGRYAFVMRPRVTKSARVEVSLGADRPVLVFRGTVR